MSEGPDDPLYELAPEAPRKVQEAAVTRPVVAKEPAGSRTIAYQSQPTPGRPLADTEQIRNIQLPMWLLVGGVVIEVVAAFIQKPSAQAALRSVGMELIVGTLLTLAGILIAAKLRGINLGDLRIAVFKLAAISVAPSAAVDLVRPVLGIIPLFGGLLALVAQFILYFALLGALFDLDESDTWYCVCIIFLVHVGFYFAFIWIAVQ